MLLIPQPDVHVFKLDEEFVFVESDPPEPELPPPLFEATEVPEVELVVVVVTGGLYCASMFWAMVQTCQVWVAP